MRAIESCRTAAMGGHKETCTSCGAVRFAYSSCRNRHCPKCQSLTKAQWLEDRKAELLPVPYYHGVFTLPHDLNGLVLSNKAVMLKVLFSAASETLLEFGENNLGGKMGFTMVLHTWDQQLRPHFHVHCVIPAGALSPGGERWTRGNPKYLFPVKALSKVFRGKFLARLQDVRRRGELSFSGSPGEFTSLFQRLRTLDWVVYAKRPFAGPEQVLEYLGRYTHRVAISNNRIVGISETEVSFTYRDRRKENVQRTATVQGEEFIRRFLLHELPKGFQRIRHFGLLANRSKEASLAKCRRLLGGTEISAPPRKLTVRDWMLELTGSDINRCASCGRATLSRVRVPPETRKTSAKIGWDTS